MNTSEIYKEINKVCSLLPEFFHGVDVKFPLKDTNKNIGDWSDSGDMGMVVTGDDIGPRSGVYFFAKPNGEVFYIGKAANLHHRVWGHVKTPDTLSDGSKTFPKHGFRCDNSIEEIKSIATGAALLGIATVSDPDLVSFLEVYLHTSFIRKVGKLPALNKQIG